MSTFLEDDKSDNVRYIYRSFQVICGQCGGDSFSIEYDKGSRNLICKSCGTVLNNYYWRRMNDYDGEK